MSRMQIVNTWFLGYLPINEWTWRASDGFEGPGGRGENLAITLKRYQDGHEGSRYRKYEVWENLGGFKEGGRIYRTLGWPKYMMEASKSMVSLGLGPRTIFYSGVPDWI